MRRIGRSVHERRPDVGRGSIPADRLQVKQRPGRLFVLAVVSQRDSAFRGKLPEESFPHVFDIPGARKLVETQFVDRRILEIDPCRPLVRVVANGAKKAEVVVVQTILRTGTGRRKRRATHGSPPHKP
jgi:hypothetical protein